MRFRFVAIALVTAASAACDSSTTVSPIPEAPKSSVFVASFSEKVDSTRLDNMYVLYGTGAIDSSDFFLGQNFLYDWRPNTIVLETDQSMNLFAAPSGAQGYNGSKKGPATIRVLSDWNPVDPDDHPGVASSGITDFLIVVESFSTKTDDTTGARIDYFWKKAVGPNPAAKITLPPEDRLRFVYAYQRPALSCAGSDSLTFRSTNGILLTYQDPDLAQPSISTWNPPEVTVTCTAYSDAQTNRIPIETMRPSLHTEVTRSGNSIMKRWIVK